VLSEVRVMRGLEEVAKVAICGVKAEVDEVRRKAVDRKREREGLLKRDRSICGGEGRGVSDVMEVDN
jgi:hypothetical protein